MMLVVPLIICATVNGFLLGYAYETGAILGALALSALTIVLTLCAENTVANTESEVKTLDARLAQSAAELDVYKEKVRQLDRIVAMVSDQNDDLRRRLQSGRENERYFIVRKSEGNVSYLRDWRQINAAAEPEAPAGTQQSGS